MRKFLPWLIGGETAGFGVRVMDLVIRIPRLGLDGKLLCPRFANQTPMQG